MMAKSVLKRIYRSIPFKREFYSLIQPVFSPSRSIYQHLHFEGPISLTVEPGKSFTMVHYGFALENDLFWAGLFGGWEKTSLRIWHQPTLLVEILNDEVARRVAKVVGGIDYLYFNIDEARGIRPSDQLSASDSRNFLICTREIALKQGLIR